MQNTQLKIFIYSLSLSLSLYVMISVLYANEVAAAGHCAWEYKMFVCMITAGPIGVLQRNGSSSRWSDANICSELFWFQCWKSTTAREARWPIDVSCFIYLCIIRALHLSNRWLVRSSIPFCMSVNVTWLCYLAAMLCCLTERTVYLSVVLVWI